VGGNVAVKSRYEQLIAYIPFMESVTTIYTSTDVTSRTSAIIQRASALSRLVDQSQIVLSPLYFQRVCQTRLSLEVIARHLAHGPVWGRPTLDVFAVPADHEYKAPTFFSLYAFPGTS
jgi:hypothetical protein